MKEIKFTKFAKDSGLDISNSTVNKILREEKYLSPDMAYLLLPIIHRLGGTYITIDDLIYPPKKKAKLGVMANKLKLSGDNSEDLIKVPLSGCASQTAG